MTQQRYPELPGWTFSLEEISAGVYEITGEDAHGRRVQKKGTDPDALLEECRRYAASLLTPAPQGRTP